MLLHLVASKPTDSVIFGFLPAAARMGLDVVVLTDQPERHQRACADASSQPRPGCPPRNRAGTTPATTQFAGCDVHDFRALIAQMAALPKPAAVLSNSDHLQAQTALAADYFGLPGKDWRAALRAKDKALMRRWPAGPGPGRVAMTEITAATQHPLPGLPYPVVLKPADGVASEDVMLVNDPGQLAQRCAEVLARRPGLRLIAEEYLPGTLRTLETISAGPQTWVTGGFRTRLSPPPFFTEERVSWDPPDPGTAQQVLTALPGPGAPFGACHTEYVLDEGGTARLIEVNDRLIGDHADFLLGDLLGTDIFELALRVYLGEPLPEPRPTASGHAVIDYVIAQRPGRVTAVPPAGDHPAEPGVRLTCWPLRRLGEQVDLARSNRDYLGLICAAGPDPAAVDRSIEALRARGLWAVSGEPQA